MNTPTHPPRSAIRKLNLVGCTALVVALGGVGGWASTTQIAGAVIATGSVVVESNVKKVQHLNGGIVGEILVREGSEVEADQVLLRLDDTLTRATLGVVQSQLDLYVAGKHACSPNATVSRTSPGRKVRLPGRIAKAPTAPSTESTDCSSHGARVSKVSARNCANG